jgi:tripartite-type tricarboxylate transporter receptor subunit TctC
MSKIGRRDTLKMALAAPFVLAGGRSWAQGAWPTRPVQMIMPFGAGGAADTAARVVFQRVSEIIGQPVIIENRTGGASVVGAQAVLSLPKDGHAFFINSSQQMITPIFVKDIPFDFKKDFVPVTKLANYPQVLAVRNDFPAQTVEELIAWAKANPEKLRYGTPPSAGPGHMAGTLIQMRTDTKWVHIPYRVTPEAARDVAAGTVDMVIITTSTIRPVHEAKKVRILAVTSAKRAKIHPTVPTVGEKLIPGFELDDWAGVFAATETPEVAIQKMQQAIAQAAREPAVFEKLAPFGTELGGDSSAEFGKFIETTREIMTKIITDAKITTAG